MQHTNKLNIKQRHCRFFCFVFYTCSLELPAAAVEKAKDLLLSQGQGCDLSRPFTVKKLIFFFRLF